jgi:hypothetical protein
MKGEEEYMGTWPYFVRDSRVQSPPNTWKNLKENTFFRQNFVRNRKSADKIANIYANSEANL